MATPLGLPRIEIPQVGSSPPSGAPVLSPFAHSESVSLPELAPVGGEQPEQPKENITTDHNDAPFLSSAISPTYITSHIPPTIQTHIVSPPFYSRSTSTSSPELLVPGPAASPLLGEEFEHAQWYLGRPHYSGIFSPRSVHSVSSRSTSALSRRISTPPSATALSASQLYTPLQMQVLRPRARAASGSTTAVLNTPSPRPRHSLYYLADDMVIFEVENYLYRVSMWLLEKESDFFRRLFARHAHAGVMGQSDIMPIPLIDVSRRDFDSILRFLHFSVYEPDTIELHEWIALLSVSTRLQFSRVRRWAIREITAQFSSLDAVTVIVLATKHNVPEWLAPAYAELCRRQEPLDDTEAEELGSTITARIGRAREAIREEWFKSSLCDACAKRIPTLLLAEPAEELVVRHVQRVFWPEAA